MGGMLRALPMRWHAGNARHARSSRPHPVLPRSRVLCSPPPPTPAPTPAALGDSQHTALLTRLACRLTEFDVSRYKAQEVSNAMWAFGTLEVLFPDTVEHLVRGVSERVVCVCTWAGWCVRRAARPPGASGHLSRNLLRRPPPCYKRTTSAPTPHRAFLASQSIPHMDAFIPQGLSNMVWACAHVKYKNPGEQHAGA